MTRDGLEAHLIGHLARFLETLQGNTVLIPYKRKGVPTQALPNGFKIGGC